MAAVQRPWVNAVLSYCEVVHKEPKPSHGWRHHALARSNLPRSTLTSYLQQSLDLPRSLVRIFRALLVNLPLRFDPQALGLGAL